MDAIIKLRKKISAESFQERARQTQTHRYYSTTHSMKVVPPISDGKYLQVAARQAPPKELTEAIGMPIPPALQSAAKKEEVNRG